MNRETLRRIGDSYFLERLVIFKSGRRVRIHANGDTHAACVELADLKEATAIPFLDGRAEVEADFRAFADARASEASRAAAGLVSCSTTHPLRGADNSPAAITGPADLFGACA